MKKHIIFDEDKQRELELLKDMQLSYNQRVMNSGKGFKLAAWECPYCKESNETVIPPAKFVHPEKGYWDSLTTCYECGNMSFMYKYADGTIDVKPIEEPKNHERGFIC